MPAEKVSIIYTAIDHASKTIKEMGTQVAKLVTPARLAKAALTALTAPLAALAVSTKAAATFESRMLNVNTITRVGTKRLEEMSKAALKLSTETGKAAPDLANALYQIASASVPAEHQLTVLEASAKAAVAGLTETETAADALTTAINAWGMDAGKAMEVSDQFFTVVERGKTTFPELAGNIAYVATTAASAGVTFEEVGAALATATRQGMRTDMASRSLNQVLLKLVTPSKELAEVYAKYGYESGQAAIKAEGFAGVLQMITNEAGGSVQKMNEFIPSSEALRVVFALTGKNIEDYTEDLKAMGISLGKTAGAMGIQEGGLGHSTKLLWAEIKVAAIEIGTTMIPAVKAAVDWLREWVKEGNWVIDTLKGAAHWINVLAGTTSKITLAGEEIMTLESINRLGDANAQMEELRKRVRVLRGAIADSSDPAAVDHLTQSLKLSEEALAEIEAQVRKNIAITGDFTGVIQEQTQATKEAAELNKNQAKETEEQYKARAAIAIKVYDMDREAYETNLDAMNDYWLDFQKQKKMRGFETAEELAAFEAKQMEEGMIARQELLQGMVDDNYGYTETMRDTWSETFDFMKEAGEVALSGIKGALIGIATGARDAKTAFGALKNAMIGVVVDYIAKWIEAMITQKKVAAGARVAEIAAGVATGSALATAYAPAAAFASTMTFGGAAHAGAAALTSTVGVAKGLALVKLAEGGIVTRPTIAMVGEAGPEAVIPLDKAGMGTTIVERIEVFPGVTSTNVVDALLDTPMFIDRLAWALEDRKAKIKRGGIQ